MEATQIRLATNTHYYLTLSANTSHLFPPIIFNGFGIALFALSARPRNTPMPLFTGDLAAAALYLLGCRGVGCRD